MVLCVCDVLLYEFYGVVLFIFFFKQKTAYEMRISDWSSDVSSSDLATYLVFFRLPRTSELMLCWRNFRPHLRAPSIIQTRGTLHRALSTSGYPPPTSPCPPANHTSWTSCSGAFFFGNGLPQYSSPAGHRSGRNIVRLSSIATA